MSAHVRDFDGVALIARETDRAGHAPLFPEANSNRFEQWPPSMLSIHARHVRPPSSCTLSGKMQQELSCLEGRLLEGRPALGIVLLTDSTV